MYPPIEELRNANAERTFTLTRDEAETLAAAAECEWGRRVDDDPDPSEPLRFLNAARKIRRQARPASDGPTD